jgi:polar amino acid transport system substrate-binding protein
MKFSRTLLAYAILSVASAFAPALALEIRTAAQDSQPKFLKDAKGFSGLCVDIFRAIERADPELNFSFQKEFVPLPRIEDRLVKGALDAFCGLAKTASRQSKLDFIELPLYMTSSVLAARSDEKSDPQSFDELRKLGADAVVMVVSQTVHAEVLGAQPGIKMDASAWDTSTNLQKLLAGRGRFVYHNDFALADEIERDKLGGKVKILSGRFASEGRFMVVSKAAPPKIKQKLTAALEKLSKSGELARVFQAYKPS